MVFKSNFSKAYLLTNKPIVFKCEGEGLSFEFIPPSVENFFIEDSLLSLIVFLEEDITKIQGWIEGYPIESHYEFLMLILALSSKDDFFKPMLNDLTNGLKVILPSLIIKDKFLCVNEKILLSPTLFDDITEVLFLSTNRKKVIIKSDDDEFTRIEKEARARAQRIRDGAKDKDKKDGTSLEDMIAAILYEFPQYKIEDILKLNVYTLYYLLRYIGKIADYEISQIAAGNGLSKKHKYFI